VKLKLILRSFILFTLVVFVLTGFAGCKKDELTKIFEDGELGDFWDFQEDNSEIVIPEKPGDDDFIDEDAVLNIEAVKRLAFGDISPFVFMKTFPVPGSEESGLYYVLLPNDYGVRIEFSGDTVNLMYLEDNLLEKSLDLQTESLFIEMFLSERD